MPLAIGGRHMSKQEALRSMPRVDDVIARVEAEPKAKNISYHELLSCVRETLDGIRKDILADKTNKVPDVSEIVKAVIKTAVKKCSFSLRPVINATGVVLHTNLGRAVLAQAAAENVSQVAREYNSLEYSLEEGCRGSRHSHVESLICKLTGAEAAMVVNNNAAAVMLLLAAMCKDREVVVSRGELVEIGGSFRVPEIMSMSGAHLKEVGTTNKTKPSDYAEAINENTAALLKVHTSNFKIVGFSEQVKIDEMVKIGHDHNIPVIYDVGSGLMVEGEKVGLYDEVGVKESVKAGADITCFSADKLLGGPQAGIIVGKKKYVEMMKKHQLARVVRIDKLNLAALEATIRIYLDPERTFKEIPTLANLAITKAELKIKANKLCGLLPVRKNGFSATVKTSESQVGGGSAPGEMLPSYAVQITPKTMSAADLEKALRENDVPIICRIHKGCVLLDPRTIFENQYAEIVRAFENIFTE